MTELARTVQSEPIKSAARDADSLTARAILGYDSSLNNPRKVTFSARCSEIIALRLSATGDKDATDACRKAFDLLRAVLQDHESRPGCSPLEGMRIRARAAAFGVLGCLHAQTRQILKDVVIDTNANESGWSITVEKAVLTAWQLLIRKRGWEDLDQLNKAIGDVRDQQADFEPGYLKKHAVTSDAWKLVAFYHLLRAAEIIAEYTEHGTANGHFDPVQQAEFHFDCAREAATDAKDPDLLFLVRLLDLVARALVERSIWRIVRGAGARAKNFAELIASRDRQNPFLDLLPPQHQALVSEGLLGAGRRSVVVSLPTSAGKTLIAEFRILRALDSYEAPQGWVAYTCPTRALVNQLTVRLRRDFAPLGIRVEQFSAALEVDSVEADILNSSQDPFRVVVTTPEKLDLLLRGGWISRLGRPLGLVIIDEAHNLGSDDRGLKLELLLATLNREAREANFMLMTPFIPNAEAIASWLDADNHQAVQMGLEWLPNDRVVGIAKLEKAQPRGDSRLVARTLSTSAPSLRTEAPVELASGRPLGLPYSKLNHPTPLATAAAEALSERGTTVTLVRRPSDSWGAAERLAASVEHETQDSLLGHIGDLLVHEYGTDYPLTRLLAKGVAVHHAGLSDDVRLMIEAIAERDKLRHIVATTTLAQGINFPINNIVLATHKYPYGETMPTEDFWNIAGRAGRANHGQPGVILVAAHNEQRETELEGYLAQAVTGLNSTLVGMVETAIKKYGDLDLARLSFMGNWSSFVQFITHTYRMAGAEEFALRVEQVLRGTLGFRELRASKPYLADALVRSVRAYTATLTGKPLPLVDSTGFSWESVKATLARMSSRGVGGQLFAEGLSAENSSALSDAIGVLLEVPELRGRLVNKLDDTEIQGGFLARVVKDWVGGMSLRDLSQSHFAGSGSETGNQNGHTLALTRCCQKLFGSILPTVSWGLSALRALSSAKTPSEESPDLSRDIPSCVYYGVDTREAIAFRLFGVPRTAAAALARTHGPERETEQIRRFLARSSPTDWTDALGDIGQSYYQAWKLVESAT